jgi:UMF1 family MFS transporter
MPINSQPPDSTLRVFSWTFYDFANTIYSMNVVSLYFSLWITVDNGREDLLVSAANSISMVLVMLTMPILGAISDQIRRRMPFLMGLTGGCILFTALIGLVGGSGLGAGVRIWAALFFFTLANYAYQGALVFYNALLPEVSTPATMGRISGYGVALGYLGAIVGLVLVMPFNHGSVLGLEIPFIAAGGRVATFVPTALFFLLFSLPIFLFVREKVSVPKDHLQADWKEGFRRVRSFFIHHRRYPGVGRFLVAKFFFENGISAVIIFMAVYAVKVMGFTDEVVMTFLLVSTTAAVAGSAGCGWLVDRWGARTTLSAVLLGWIFSLALVLATGSRPLFWTAGALIGIFLGGTWTASRPLMVSLVPEKMLGEFFGLYAFSGKAAAIVGPLIWGLVVISFSELGVVKYKLAVGSLLLLILIGLLILRSVPGKDLSGAAAGQ